MNNISEKILKRFKIVTIVIFSGFFILTLRVFYLSLNRDFKTFKITNKKIIPRGEILDRNSEKLATSIKLYSAFCNPLKLKLTPEKIKKLSEILNIPENNLTKIFNSKKSFCWLKRKIDFNTYKKISDLNIEGIYFTQEYKRIYPNGRLASHILGIVNIDNIGIEGAELYYDKYLNSETSFSKEDENFNIVLTIDKNIQYIVESELRKQFIKTKSKYATAIVIQPYTGEILAMVSLPDFDPNNFNLYPQMNRLNRAISFLYEPGSVFKIFTISALLSENVVKENEYFYCPGYIKIGDEKIECWKKHGRLNLEGVIKESCNVGIIESIFRISRYKLYEYYQNFGLCSFTGIDLPGESKPILSQPKKWPLFTKASISIGQGVAVTSLHLLTAACSIFNNGKIVQPHILKAVIDSKYNLYKEFKPITIRQAISPEIATKVASLLKGVVEEEGTGKLAYIKGYSIAGKTGTGQIYIKKLNSYSKTKVNASFIGFIPAEKPKYGIIVSFHEPLSEENTGGGVAAPVFKAITEKLISYQPIPSEKIINEKIDNNKLTFFYETDNKNIKDITHLPDFKGMNMRETLKIIKMLNLRPNLIGTGIAYHQIPPPNTKITPNMLVTVYFKLSDKK